MKKLVLLFLTVTLSIGYLAHAEDIIEFHIPEGTGSKPWNTPKTTVNVKVGQVLRIINNDDIPHTLHTFGRPCPHQPQESLPGKFYDCEIATTADPNIDLLYEHSVGVQARFYLKATK